MKPNLDYHDFFNDDTGQEPGKFFVLVLSFPVLIPKALAKQTSASTCINVPGSAVTSVTFL